MNYLYISRSELRETSCPSPNGILQANIIGKRAGEVIKDHDLRSGLTIACVVENLGRGKVIIAGCSLDNIELQIKIEEPLPKRLELDLVIAYSRPQTLKKIFQLSASSGVRSLSFVRTQNVEKSYLKSKSLDLDQIQRQLILGCEQVGDGIFPVVNHYSNLGEFLDSNMLHGTNTFKLFGDVSSESNIIKRSGNIVLFLGPESGLTNQEKSTLISAGFSSASLGPRVFRVEIAAAMLLGAII